MKDQKKFKQGVVWNLASIIFLAVSGVGLNLAVGFFYDEAALGVFNQVLATYIFFGMVAVGGLNLSALKLISESPEEESKQGEVIFSAVLMTLVCSAAVTALYWISRGAIASWLDSPAVKTGMTWVTPGLFFFGVNKTLLSIINGLNHMRAFAIFQSLRYLNLLVGLGIGIALEAPGETLAGVFSYSESFLFFALAIYLRGYWKLPPGPWSRWVPHHLRFGAKGFLSGALLELNSRVDILMLGYFLSDAKVGIYSIAALIFEGFMQFLVVLQHNYNPHVSKWIHAKKFTELLDAFRKGRWRTYKYALFLVPAIILLFPVGVKILFFDKPEFLNGWMPFGILMGGLFLSAGYVPFHNILLMGGRPGWHTAFIGTNALFNVLFNWILIPIWGLEGAALATAMSLVLSNLTLVILTRLRLGIRLV